MVPAVTIDDLVAEAGARSISLVKIDVQGAEMLVLEGAKRTLGEMRPALFVEVDDRNLADFGLIRSRAHRAPGAGWIRDARTRQGRATPEAVARWAFRQFADSLRY